MKLDDFNVEELRKDNLSIINGGGDCTSIGYDFGLFCSVLFDTTFSNIADKATKYIIYNTGC